MVLTVTCFLVEVMAEGYQSRFLEFQHFERVFKACLSSSAVQTKVKRHYKRVTDTIKQLEVLLTEAEQECASSWCVFVCVCVCVCWCMRALYTLLLYSSSTHCFRQQLAVDLHECNKHQQKLNNVQKIKEGGNNIVLGIPTAVDRKITMIFDDVISQMSSLVNSLDVTFDQHNLLLYKEVRVW